jgi:hypothetical protein
MESDEEKIKVIKIKVRNTLNLNKVSRDVLRWVEEKSSQDSSFRGHYFLPHELTMDIKLIDNPTKQRELIAWLKERRTTNPIIKRAINGLEET